MIIYKGVWRLIRRLVKSILRVITSTEKSRIEIEYFVHGKGKCSVNSFIHKCILSYDLSCISCCVLQ